jgi:AcrR family transcriptional regulator
MVKKETGARSSRPGLNRDLIINTALRIFDEEGYQALSMRRLGAELKVDPMAIYYHVPNKAALLDGFVEVVMGEIDLGQDDPTRPVEERLLTAAHVYREVLLAHPQAVQVIAVRSMNTAISLRPVELLLGIFRQAGFSPTDALASVNIFGRFIKGVVMLDVRQMEEAELNRVIDTTLDEVRNALPTAEFPFMHEVMEKAQFIGLEAEFDRGVRALIRGLCEEYATNQEVTDVS